MKFILIIINDIGEQIMEDRIKELATSISRLQIRNERLEEEVQVNNDKIKEYTNELNEILEEQEENKNKN
jgi:predicted RNase H-like nuclease (RuvC/YqgF family)